MTRARRRDRAARAVPTSGTAGAAAAARDTRVLLQIRDTKHRTPSGTTVRRWHLRAYGPGICASSKFAPPSRPRRNGSNPLTLLHAPVSNSRPGRPPAWMVFAEDVCHDRYTASAIADAVRGALEAWNTACAPGEQVNIRAATHGIPSPLQPPPARGSAAAGTSPAITGATTTALASHHAATAVAEDLA